MPKNQAARCRCLDIMSASWLDGSALAWLNRVHSLLPNGTHAVVVESELVRVEMFRYEHTYDLLITRHWLEGRAGRRPELRSELLYLGRCGTLATELWGRDAAFRGGAQPVFFTRSGEQPSRKKRPPVHDLCGGDWLCGVSSVTDPGKRTLP